MNDPHVSPVELSATSDASPRPGVPHAPPDFGRSPLRILVAEDNRTLRRLLALVLRRDGHEVAEACDAGELLEAARWHEQAGRRIARSDPADGVRHCRRVTTLLAAGALLWLIIEIAFALKCFPAVPRYLFEAGAVVANHRARTCPAVPFGRSRSALRVARQRCMTRCAATT